MGTTRAKDLRDLPVEIEQLHQEIKTCNHGIRLLERKLKFELEGPQNGSFENVFRRSGEEKSKSVYVPLIILNYFPENDPAFEMSICLTLVLAWISEVSGIRLKKK